MRRVPWDDPVKRYRKTMEFCEKKSLKPQAKMYRQRIEALAVK